MHCRRLALAVLLALPCGAGRASADTYVWVDERGTTHLTSDPGKVPEAHRGAVVGKGVELSSLWDGELRGPEVAPLARDSNRPEARNARLLRGAVDDLRHGETARATTTLRGVLTADPANATAHWYLALLERQRGHFEAAAEHLRSFLTHAGSELEPWRASARERLAALEDERRLIRAASTPSEFHALSSANFHVQYDRALALATPDYAATVLRYLEEAHDHLAREWGVAPAEPTGVVLYGKAAYVLAHSHRFSFDTVGFYDGRIHVVSAAHPAGELRSLLFHEYTHALFRESAGSDRPFWLNEGLAELAERASQGRPALARSERARLRRAIDEGSWLPLRRLAPSFSGLDQDGAKLAYLEATAAAAWLEARTDVEARRALVRALGRGRSADAALLQAVGLDTDGVDDALRRTITAAFPAAALAPDEAED